MKEYKIGDKLKCTCISGELTVKYVLSNGYYECIIHEYIDIKIVAHESELEYI